MTLEVSWTGRFGVIAPWRWAALTEPRSCGYGEAPNPKAYSNHWERASILLWKPCLFIPEHVSTIHSPWQLLITLVFLCVVFAVAPGGTTTTGAGRNITSWARQFVNQNHVCQRNEPPTGYRVRVLLLKPPSEAPSLGRRTRNKPCRTLGETS